MLNTSIENLPSTSPITIRKFKSLGINTYFDSLNYFPTRYEDYSIISKIDKIQVGEIVTISGKIIEAKNQYTRSRITIQKVVITDDTGTVEVNWFNQPYLIRVFKIGGNISVAGLVKQFIKGQSSFSFISQVHVFRKMNLMISLIFVHKIIKRDNFFWERFSHPMFN